MRRTYAESRSSALSCQNNMEFRRYSDDDYEALCDFLIELNRDDKSHINWNWARFEWMYEHPEFDRSLKNSIGLWLDNGKVAGAAVYDMYFGEAFCAAARGYDELYPEILSYAYNELSDESGLGVAICDDNKYEIEDAESCGFTVAEQTETMMSVMLDRELEVNLPVGFSFERLDPAEQPCDFQWLLWQGFDHGVDRAEFERCEKIVPQVRAHFNPYLSVAVVNESGEKLAYCCLWYSDKTDYAYVEPVCTIPSYRGMGLSKAVIHEALNRARSLGAVKAYVLSDMDFYRKLGFKEEKHFTFWWKE